ncbi:MAG TPA: lysylphosphatidylglycerol synthase transmembrane domain-containing protein [Steroidobacteraceae bacterium]|nr:lysylphosphatidylglycerol synthase transmembrane domain-containing protein [Steroidobacteraceae bacterium]
MRQLARFLPHLAVVAFAIWSLYCIRHDLVQLPLSSIARSWDLVVLALLLSLLNYILRIIRWRFYLSRLGHFVGFRFAALTYTAGFAYTLVPGKVGEMVRARYYIPVGVPLVDVTAAFFAERLMDLLAMTALAALVFTASPRYQRAFTGAAVIIAMALALLVLVPWASVAGAVQPRVGPRSRTRSGLAALATALAATRLLLRPSVLVFGFAIGLAAWGLEGAGLGLLRSMFPATGLSLTTAIGIYGLSVLIGAVSFLPGGLGSTEAVMTALLAVNGLKVNQALLLTLTCRLVTLWFAVALGWLCGVALRPKQSVALNP